MSLTLNWDVVGERYFERGVDRVVIYLNDGEAIPWCGVVSISEDSVVSTSATYFEGNKVSSIVETDSFSASINAITFPEIVSKLEGSEEINRGLYLTNQHPRTFNMSYRTGIGDDLNGAQSSAKIHILFDVMLVPSAREYVTINAESDVMTFEWQIVSIPPEVGNYRPTAHVILDERSLPNAIRDQLYISLYGDGINPPGFNSAEDLIQQILTYSSWQYIMEPNEYGIFVAIPYDDSSLIEIDDQATFDDIDYELYELQNVEIEWLDDAHETLVLIDGYGITTNCDPRSVGSIIQTVDDSNGCYHLVRSAIGSDETSHYIGTAPLGSQEIHPVWKITKIIFGPPVTIQIRKNIPWTEREL